MKYTETVGNSERFCLHDSKVSKMEFVDGNLTLTFSEGFWGKNEQGKLVKQYRKCKIIYKFMIPEDRELNLDIYRETTRKRKEIKFNKFSELVNKYGFRIYREFRCSFTTQLILEGNINRETYSLMTQEIEEIVYEYDDE